MLLDFRDGWPFELLWFGCWNGAESPPFAVRAKASRSLLLIWSLLSIVSTRASTSARVSVVLWSAKVRRSKV